MTEFDEYIVHGEPGQKEKADALKTAMACQIHLLCVPLEYYQYLYLREVWHF